jgi:hypothetical protein
MIRVLMIVFVAAVLAGGCGEPGADPGASAPVVQSCDDGVACTADYTNAAGACVHIPQDGCCMDNSDCSDGNACTEDNCKADGSCEHIELVCDDGIGCTVDICVSSGDDAECVFQRDDSRCPFDMVCSEHTRGCAGYLINLFVGFF